MQTSDAGLALIRRFEGFSPTPYRCPAGYLTIGYGHVIGPRESFARIEEAEALAWLKQDVRVAEQAVSALIAVALRQG